MNMSEFAQVREKRKRKGKKKKRWQSTSAVQKLGRVVNFHDSHSEKAKKRQAKSHLPLPNADSHIMII